MYKVHMHAGAIRKLLYGCAYVREIILVVPGFGFVISDWGISWSYWDSPNVF